ncbi:MAG TPA: hypothetical protein V6C76_12670 [Drouetiella sp.]
MQLEDLAKEYTYSDGNWILPEPSRIVAHLRTAGGFPLRLVQAVAESEQHESLLFAIDDLMSRKENLEIAKEYEGVCAIGRKTAALFGKDRLLQKFAAGELPKNASLLIRILQDVESYKPPTGEIPAWKKMLDSLTSDSEENGETNE